MNSTPSDPLLDDDAILSSCQRGQSCNHFLRDIASFACFWLCESWPYEQSTGFVHGVFFLCRCSRSNTPYCTPRVTCVHTTVRTVTNMSKNTWTDSRFTDSTSRHLTHIGKVVFIIDSRIINTVQIIVLNVARRHYSRDQC